MLLLSTTCLEEYFFLVRAFSSTLIRAIILGMIELEEFSKLIMLIHDGLPHLLNATKGHCS